MRGSDDMIICDKCKGEGAYHYKLMSNILNMNEQTSIDKTNNRICYRSYAKLEQDIDLCISCRDKATKKLEEFKL